jgi:hypothetical protein
MTGWWRGCVVLGLTAGCIITREDQEGREVGGVTVWVRGPHGEPVDAAVSVAGVSLGMPDAAGIARTAPERQRPAGSAVVSATAAGRADGFARVGVRAYADAAVTLTLPRLTSRWVPSVADGAALAEYRRFAVVFAAGALVGPSGDFGMDQQYVFAGPGDPGLPPATSIQRYGTPQVEVKVEVPVHVLAAVYLGPRTPAGIRWGSERATFRVSLTEPMRDILDAAGGAVGLYALDPAVGAWVRRGPGRTEENYVAGEGVDGDGWWALAVDAGCVSGRVLDHDGDPVVGAEVVARSPTLAGAWRTQTDQSGSFLVGGSLDGTVTALGFGPRRERLFVASAAPTGEPSSCHDPDRGGALRAELRLDKDGDGFFAGGEGGDLCDDDRERHPGAPDLAGDGIDQDCDGIDGVDADRDGHADDKSGGDDCDDRDPERHPGRPEVCDGHDDDCDTTVPPGGLPRDGEDCIPCSPQAVIDLGPVLYWTLDEGDEVLSRNGVNWFALDASGHGNDGRVVGLQDRRRGVTWQDETTPLWPKAAGNEVWLSPVSGWPTSAVTMSLWLRPNRKHGVPLSYTVEGDEVTSTSGHEHDKIKEFGHVDQFSGWRTWIHRHRHEFAASLSNGEWHHVVTTYDAHINRARLYVNGILQTPEEGLPFTHEPETPDEEGEPVDPDTLVMVPGGRLYLGQDQDEAPPALPALESVQSFSGLIDEVAVFDRVLSSDEVQLLYATALCGGHAICTGPDPRLLGTGRECPAEDCEAIREADLDIGDGELYWVDGHGEAALARCLFEPSPAITVVCGDGDPIPPYEACDDDADPDCVECARVTGLPHCAAIQAAGHDEDAVYWLDTDGGEPSNDLMVRCADGWTQVLNQDLSEGYLFLDQPDALGGDSLFPLVHPDDVPGPFHPAYSILQELRRLAVFQGAQQNLDLRLVWPDPPDGQRDLEHSWTQRNPLAALAVDAKEPPNCRALNYDPLDAAPTGEPSFAGLLVGDCLDVNKPEFRSLLVGALPDPVSGELDFAVGVSGKGADNDALYPLHVPGLGGSELTWRVQLWVRPTVAAP